LVTCIVDVIFVAHKSMITIPTPIVTTLPWYAAILDFLFVLAVPVLLNM